MQNTFKAVRIVKTHKMELCADARTIFPLLCPVKELDWIEGWDKICNMIYTESGIAEEGCIFETNKTPEGKSIWICNNYDLEKTKIEYIKHIIDKIIIKWSMEVKDESHNKSSIFVNYVVTSLTDEGNTYAKDYMEVTFPALMRGMEEGMNRYVISQQK
jgi:hypothetical protein